MEENKRLAPMQKKKVAALCLCGVLALAGIGAGAYFITRQPQEPETEPPAQGSSDSGKAQKSGKEKNQFSVTFEAGEHGKVLESAGETYSLQSPNFSFSDAGRQDMGVAGACDDNGELKESFLYNVNDFGDQATFSNVIAPAEGEYTVKVLYTSANEGVNQHTVYVNGERQKVITYAPTGKWNTLEDGAEAAVTVTLKEGANTIGLHRELGCQGYAQIGALSLMTETFETQLTVKKGEKPAAAPRTKGDAGWCFAGWKDADGNDVDPLTREITDDVVYTASFAEDLDGNGVPDEEDSSVQVTYRAGENGYLREGASDSPATYPVSAAQLTTGSGSTLDRYEYYSDFEGKTYGVAYNLDQIGDGLLYTVSVPESGEYGISVPFTSEIACSTHTVKVNGAYAGYLVYPGLVEWGDFSTAHQSSLRVNLQAGTNEIWIGKQAGDAGAAMISDLTVSRRPETRTVTERVAKGESPSEIPVPVAAVGYRFAGWKDADTGEFLSPTSRGVNRFTVYMAVFSKDPDYTPPVKPEAPAGPGTVSESGYPVTFQAGTGGKVSNLPKAAVQNAGSQSVTYWEDGNAMFKAGIASVMDSGESADPAQKGYYDGQAMSSQGYEFETFYAYNLNDPEDVTDYGSFTAPANGWYRFRTYYSSTFTLSSHSLFVDGEKKGVFIYRGSSGAWGVFSHNYYADCMVYLQKGAHALSLKKTDDDVAYAMPSDLYIAVRLTGDSITLRAEDGTKLPGIPVAEPQEGYLFKGWKNESGLFVNPQEAVITGETKFTAIFEKDEKCEPPVPPESKEYKTVLFLSGVNGRVYNIPETALNGAGNETVTYYDGDTAMFKAGVSSVTDAPGSEDAAQKGYYDGQAMASNGYEFETFYAFNLNDPGDAADYGAFTAPVDGYYNLRAYYSTTFEKSSHTVMVNGKEAGRFLYEGSSGAWGAFGHGYFSDCTLYLKAGENHITLCRTEQDEGYAMVSDLYLSARYGGDGLQITLEKGARLLSVPSVQPASGYLFAEWKNENGETVDPGSSAITEDTLFIASYDEDLNRNGIPDTDENLVQVLYHAGDGGSLSQRYLISDIRKGEGSNMAVFEDAATGWKHAYNVDVAGDKVLYYVTAPKDGAYTMKLRYACGADSGQSMTVWVNDAEQEKAMFTGLQDGWNFNTERYSEFTVTLKRGVNAVAVGRMDGDGSAMLSDLFLTGNTAAEYLTSGDTALFVPQAVPVTGLAAAGWQDSRGNLWDSVTPITSNSEFTAVYKTDANGDGIPDENQNIVTYRLKDEDAANGAKLNADDKEWVLNGERPSKIPAPSMPGNLFDYWVNADGETVNPAEIAVDSDVTYTAVFTDSVTVTYQAGEGGLLSLGSFSPAYAQKGDGASGIGIWPIGDGFDKVANIDYINDCAVYQLNAPSDGTYTLKVRYSTGNTNTQHSVWVNDGYAGSMLYVDANGWDAWNDKKYAELAVTLKKGQNVVKIGRGGEYDGYAQLAEITILTSAYSEILHPGDTPAFVPSPVPLDGHSFWEWDITPGGAVNANMTYTAKFN